MSNYAENTLIEQPTIELFAELGWQTQSCHNEACGPAKDAFDNNLRDDKDTIPQLFWHNAIVIRSNGRDARIGAITSE